MSAEKSRVSMQGPHDEMILHQFWCGVLCHSFSPYPLGIGFQQKTSINGEKTEGEDEEGVWLKGQQPLVWKWLQPFSSLASIDTQFSNEFVAIPNWKEKIDLVVVNALGEVKQFQIYKAKMQKLNELFSFSQNNQGVYMNDNKPFLKFMPAILVF